MLILLTICEARMDRRQFALGSLGLAANLAASLAACPAKAQTAAYTGPNVVLVRFGGGVRRAETIDEAATYAPFLPRLCPTRSRGT